MRKGQSVPLIIVILLALFQLPGSSTAEAASSSITIQEIIFKNSAGVTVEVAGINQQILLSSILHNNENDELSYVNIFDIRNGDDVSIIVILSEGVIGAKQSGTLDVVWEPEKLGTYSVRQFLITDVDAPEILSTVETRSLIVSNDQKTSSENETETLPSPVEGPAEETSGIDEGPARYTILVYMVASDLESQGYTATSDIMEMMEADIASDVNVIVQTGGSANSTIDDQRFIDFTTVQRHRILDHDVKTVIDLGQKNMGNSRTLQEFITWSVSEYPAEKYGIVLWDHGNGIRGFGLDDIYYDYLTIEEFRDAFAQAKKTTGVQFEFIGFDACLMATYEVATWISPYADYLISSEEIVPEWGWDYNAILSSLGSADQMDGQLIGKIIADSYMTHSKTKTEEFQGYDAHRWITLSVIDLSKMRDVRDLANDLGDALHIHINDLGKAQTLAKTLLHTERYGIDYGGSAGYSDLYELAENLGQSFPRYASMADKLQAKIEEAVVYNVRGDAKPNAHGISIYLQLDDYQSGSEHLIYLDSGWLGVIEGGAKRLAADDDPPTGWLDYSDGKIEGASDVDDIAYGFISFYRESGTSRYEVVADYYLDPSRFLRSDGSIEYELNEGILSLCSGDDCAPAFVYLEDNGETQYAYFPVRLESGEYDQRVSLIYEIDNGEFIFIGAWEGIEEGTAQRGLRPLENGDNVFTYTYEYDDEDYDYFAELESKPIEVAAGFGPRFEEYDETFTFDMSFCDFAENCAGSDLFEL